MCFPSLRMVDENGYRIVPHYIPFKSRRKDGGGNTVEAELGYSPVHD